VEFEVSISWVIDIANSTNTYRFGIRSINHYTLKEPAKAKINPPLGHANITHKCIES
jgi:hypothetical protein